MIYLETCPAERQYIVLFETIMNYIILVKTQRFWRRISE